MEDLITRSLAGELSSQEADQLSAWRSESPANEAYYRRRIQLWEWLSRADRSNDTGPPPRAAELIRRSGIRAFRGVQAELPRSRRWSIAAMGAAAAAAVLAIAGSRLGRDPPPTRRFAPVEFVTATAEVATVRLDDGTVVRLGPESRLRFDEGTGGGREVWLRGRAFFAVAKDSIRPFTVHTTVGDARALGTRFELQADGTRLRLVVVEGRVALTAASQRVVVGANQVSHAGPSEAPSVMNVDDAGLLLDWVNGLFVFNDTPLSQVALQLERHFGVTIVIGDSSLARRTVTAWFQEQSFDGVLQSVCRAVAASCSINERGATIRP